MVSQGSESDRLATSCAGPLLRLSPLVSAGVFPHSDPSGPFSMSFSFMSPSDISREKGGRLDPSLDRGFAMSIKSRAHGLQCGTSADTQPASHTSARTKGRIMGASWSRVFASGTATIEMDKLENVNHVLTIRDDEAILGARHVVRKSCVRGTQLFRQQGDVKPHTVAPFASNALAKCWRQAACCHSCVLMERGWQQPRFSAKAG